MSAKSMEEYEKAVLEGFAECVEEAQEMAVDICPPSPELEKAVWHLAQAVEAVRECFREHGMRQDCEGDDDE